MVITHYSITVRNSSLCSDVVFEKEVIVHEFDFETSSLEFEVSKSSIRKQTQLRVTMLFFLSLLSRRPIEVNKFTSLLFYANVEIHQL